VRSLLSETRARVERGEEADLEAALATLGETLARRVAAAAAPSLVPLINATGVVIHTNLGRAPLSKHAAARVARIASSYSNLEFDIASGERGNREAHAEVRLRELLLAEASVVVNNNAAAVLLAINTLAEGREVLVSRGELVEIGGSFRIPDVLRKGGARLREVGTTNRTRLSDYESALGPETALILKVHRSNFEIVGFTEATSVRALGILAHAAKIPLVEDLGSGLLGPLEGPLDTERSVSQSLEEGADLVTFSGDKLLGGPQAGLVVGRRAMVDALRRNPLYRALRVDKMTLAALDAVLGEHEAGRAQRTVPVRAMLALKVDDIRVRAEELARRVSAAHPEVVIELVEGSSAVGGGAAPTTELPTLLLTCQHPSRGPDELAAALRQGDPPVVARVAEDRLVLDLRSVDESEDGDLERALSAALL
jgi:L-seryl-tRNA(Ser) seleniumtransferase